VLAPKAVLANWASEAAQWAPDMRVLLFDGTPQERNDMLRQVGACRPGSKEPAVLLRRPASAAHAARCCCRAKRCLPTPACACLLPLQAVEPGAFDVLVTHYDLVMREKGRLRKVRLRRRPPPGLVQPCWCSPERASFALPISVPPHPTPTPTQWPGGAVYPGLNTL
jgi:SNF2 family DNA or RNA helicase